MTMIKHTGGCHCGRVRFEVMAPAQIEVGDCNCSMCSKTGFLHLVVKKDQFKLLSGEDALTNYQFNTKKAEHFFARTAASNRSTCRVRTLTALASTHVPWTRARSRA